MRLAVSVLVTNLIFTQALHSESYDYHPFTGENQDAQIIDLGYRTTHRAEPIADTIHKYDRIVSKRKYPTYKSNWDQAVSMVFGAS